MRFIIGILCLLLICTTPATVQNQHTEKFRFFIQPRESILPVIVNQPDCPLVFEKASVLQFLGGGGGGRWQVRNCSSKPITRATIATIELGGAGSLSGYEPENESDWIMPGQLWPRPEEDLDKKIEIVPLTKDLRKQYKVGPPMMTVIFFMVVRIELSDGSIYSDESVYKALKDMCEKTDPPLFKAFFNDK